MKGAIVAVVLAMLCTAAYVSAMPTGNVKDNCLTPEQKRELVKITNDIKEVLNAAVLSLDIAAAAEKDNKTKTDLELAAKVIKAVNVEIVANLTKIINSACGNCSEIVAAVTEGVDAIETALTDIEPDWKNNKIFETVTAAISDILSIVKILCPSSPSPYTKTRFVQARLTKMATLHL